MSKNFKKILLGTLVLCLFFLLGNKAVFATNGQVSVPGTITFSTEETRTSSSLPKTPTTGQTSGNNLPKTAAKDEKISLTLLGVLTVGIVIFIKRKWWEYAES